MKIKVSGLTDVGLKRDNNQDYFIVDESLGLFVLADGMGGHLGGEVASQIASETIQTVVKENSKKKEPMAPIEILQEAYSHACQAVYNRSQEDSKLKGMGTTAVSVLLGPKSLYVASVGDSRCYLIHPPYIWQMTEDHSLLNEQIRAGLVKPEQAQLFTARNVITRSVGFEETVSADVVEREITEGDYLLLCSDGLSGLVSDRRICDVCLTLPFDDVAPRLVEEAKRSGGDDNITIIFLQAHP
jgi:serine/threonine protein phosphatase PrpC